MRKLVIAASTFASATIGVLLFMRWRRARDQQSPLCTHVAQQTAEQQRLNSVIELRLMDKRDEALARIKGFVGRVDARSFRAHLLLVQLTAETKRSSSDSQLLEGIERLRAYAKTTDEHKLVDITLSCVQEPQKLIAFRDVPEDAVLCLFLASQQLMLATGRLTDSQKSEFYCNQCFVIIVVAVVGFLVIFVVMFVVATIALMFVAALLVIVFFVSLLVIVTVTLLVIIIFLRLQLL